MYESDVHLKAGLNCIDCHRNGLEHDMVRGYENDMSDKPDRINNIKSGEYKKWIDVNYSRNILEILSLFRKIPVV